MFKNIVFLRLINLQKWNLYLIKVNNQYITKK